MNAGADSRRLRRIGLLFIELLLAHRLRTTLSLAGMVVGVATVMVMVSLGKGAERRIVERVRAMGTDVIVVTSPPAARVAGRERQVSTATALRVGDAQAIREGSAHAAAAAPVVQRVLVASVDDRNTSVPVVGTTTEGLGIRRIRVSHGRLFEDDEDRERRRVALLGETVARALFGDADPLGREVRIGPVAFDVIGRIAPRGTDVGGTDLDNEIVIPLETAMRRLLNVPFVTSIIVQAPDIGRLDRLEADARAILAERHPARAREGGALPFLVTNQAVVLRTERGAVQALNRMVLAVAALTLLVGSVGIMTVMLLSVRDRVREIGLRRAVGARRRDIQLQFLVEAAMLAGAGGAIGVVTGLAVALGAAATARWEFAFSLPAAAAGLVISAGCGVLAGAVPAARAARLTPLAALRS